MKGDYAMPMKAWERDIIEYKPEIGLHRDILSTVIPQNGPAKFQPSAVADKLAGALAIDMLDRQMASLSKAGDLLRRLESSLDNNERFITYQNAIEADDLSTARRIYFDNLSDIDGNADLDVYPVLRDTMQEMENYLDYLNDSFFSGEADYSDLAPVREREERDVTGLLDLESDDLRLLTPDDLSDDQRRLIQRLIDDPEHPLKTEGDYIRHLNDDMRSSGSRRVDYRYWADRVQLIAAANEKTTMFRELIEHISVYLSSALSDYVMDDLQGSLDYLVDIRSSLDDMRDALATSFDFFAKRSQSSYVNTLRVSNGEMRQFLDGELKTVQERKNRLTRRLKILHTAGAQAELGAQTFLTAAAEAARNGEGLWKYILTEHIGTTDMNRDQHKEFFGALAEKRKHQILYRYAGIVSREFDWEHADQEKIRFISIHNLHKLR